MKYLFIQNIVTPYRNSFFNALAKAYSHFNFEVLYMARTEPDRSWIIPESEMCYKYEIFKGFHKVVKGFFIHFNPRLIKYVIDNKNATVICGGSWNDLNIMIICFLKRLQIVKSDLVFWSEANYLTKGASKKNFFRDILRSFIYNTSTKTIIVPGEMSRKSFVHWNLNFDNYINLPNVIEEEAYNSNVEHRYDISELPIFLMPVRLIESIKGIVNFFKSIGEDNIRRAVFYVCGDGPDKDLIESFIINNHYEDNIELKGWCDSSLMKAFYQECDAFILPSYSDPSPLSVVEALYAHMPLLLSERCGNHFEALKDNCNGFLFDPTNISSVRLSYEKLLNNRAKWKDMGDLSRQVFEKNFAQKVVIGRFVNMLSQIYG